MLAFMRITMLMRKGLLIKLQVIWVTQERNMLREFRLSIGKHIN